MSFQLKIKIGILQSLWRHLMVEQIFHIVEELLIEILLFIIFLCDFFEYLKWKYSKLRVTENK